MTNLDRVPGVLAKLRVEFDSSMLDPTYDTRHDAAALIEELAAENARLLRHIVAIGEAVELRDIVAIPALLRSAALNPASKEANDDQ